MRLFIFAILVTAFVAVTPQNEGRTRTRGLRRFSLSTPALKAAKTTDGNELIEENLTDPQAPSEPQTRSRGTNTLRRGRPSLRLRSRTSDQTDASPVIASDTTSTKDEPSETSAGKREGGGGGGGLRIRRPLKKITTTTTTTTTEQTIVESVATESLPEMQQPISTNEHAKEKQVEGMLTEESNAVLKDEVIQDQSEKLMSEKKMEKPLVQEEEPIKEEVPSEPMPESLPKMKKLRPIPIKIRRRGKEGMPEAEESPRHIANPEPEQQEAATDAKPSAHRFARPRPRLQTRKRPVNRESTLGTETRRESVGSTAAAAAAEQDVQSQSPQRLRSRGDVPSLRRPSRISSGQKPAEVLESQPESTFADVAFEESQPESRNTESNQLEKPLRGTTVIEETVEPTKKRVRIKTRIQKPSTTKAHAKKDLDPVVPDSLLEAPISDSVKAGRPSVREPENEQVPQHRERQSQISKFPTPNYGGSDLIFKGGEVQITQIGTIENTPIEQVHSILSGFGSRRRGLARSNNPKEEAQVRAQTNEKINSPIIEKPALDSLTASSNHELTSNLDELYDYYEY